MRARTSEVIPGTLLMDADEFAFKAAFKASCNYYIPMLDKEQAEEDFLKELESRGKDWIRKHGHRTLYDSVVYGEVENSVKVEVVLDKEICFRHLDRLVKERYNHPDINKVIFCYSTGGNYRYDVAKINPYKGQRRTEKPEHFEEITQYILDTFECITEHGMETDDILGIEHTRGVNKGSTIIESQDKDLRTIPGRYLKKGEIIDISEIDATRWLYTQILTGDAVDNVYTIPGMGPKTAEKALSGCETEVDMFWKVHSSYEGAMKAPLSKRKFRAEGRGILPDITQRSVESVLGEIGKLIFIQRADKAFWWPDTPEINKLMGSIG